jgi:hypothetical protein
MRRSSRARSCERIETPPDSHQLPLEEPEMTACLEVTTPKATGEKDEPSRCGSPSRVRRAAKLTEEQRESIRAATEALFATLGDRFWEDKKAYDSDQRTRTKIT